MRCLLDFHYTCQADSWTSDSRVEKRYPGITCWLKLYLGLCSPYHLFCDEEPVISTHLPILYFLIFWSGQLLQSIKCYSNFLIQLVKYLLDYIWFLSLMRNLTFSQIIFLPQFIRCWLCAFYFVKHFICIVSFNSPKPLWNRYYYSLCFVNEQTEKQRHLASCLRWHNQCHKRHVITSYTASWWVDMLPDTRLFHTVRICISSLQISTKCSLSVTQPL